MLKIDQTTKFLLTAIVVLLAVILCKPLIKLTTQAWGQANITSPTADTNPIDVTLSQGDGGGEHITGYRVSQVSTATVPKGDKLRGVHIIDSAQSFLLQYDNRVEVYRVDAVKFHIATPTPIIQ